MNRKTVREEALIPEGWQKVALGEFMEFKNGINADKSAYGQGTKFVNIMDVFRKSFLKKDDITGLVRITDKQLSEYSVVHGDILFNRTSETREEIAYSTVYTDKETVTFGGFVIRGRQKKNLLLPAFAGYCFKNETTRKEMIRRSQGAVRANIGQKDLNKIPILIPPKDEQEKIAQIFSKWDTVIEKTEKLTAAKQKWFEWLLKTLITDNCYKWKHYRSIDLFKSVSKKGFSNEQLLSATQDKGVVPRDTLEGRVMSPSGNIQNYKLVEPGNFAISLRSFQGGIEYSAYRGVISPAYTVLVPVQKIVDDFYRYFFKSYIFVEKYLSLAVIGIRDGKQINFDDFKTIKIPYPALKHQKEIADTLNIARQEIDMLKQLAEKYRIKKRGLMHKLLTGQWKTLL